MNDKLSPLRAGSVVGCNVSCRSILSYCVIASRFLILRSVSTLGREWAEAFPAAG